jgi:formate C-acetyltransferase
MTEWNYATRLDALRATKLVHTAEKQAVIGAMDHDDHALILPPVEARRLVQSISGSGEPITDVLLNGFQPISNHASGGFFGPRATGANFRTLLELHPPYVDARSSLLGGYCVNFGSYRKVGWNPDFNYSHLVPEQQKYRLKPGIGGAQHFCQDLTIGLELGFGGLLKKIRYYRPEHGPEHAAFYDGLADVVLGIQAWIRTNVAEARRLADQESDPGRRANLLELAEINECLAQEPPRTFREACQWIAWYDMAARMYNGSGSLGRLDVVLRPFYERDVAAGILDDEEAIFHLACLLILDTAYIQLGGPDSQGSDVTNRVSYLTLEAAHQLQIPANVAVCVGKDVDPGLLRRGVEILCQDRTGVPKFLGIDNWVTGFARNGYPLEIARQRAYSGCHWSAIPGREYTLNDIPKVNLAGVFLAAWDDLFAGQSAPGVAELWRLFEQHLRRALAVMAEGLDFHMAHMHEVFPELVLDLLCHGTIEKGLDASHDGVEFYNLCVDASALATVADSFAALAQRVEREGRLTWPQIHALVESNWAGPDGERVRLMMRNIPRYGSGGSLGDEYALRIVRLFTDIVKEKPTPAGYNLIPGIFSWALMGPMGKDLKATPNGRRAGDPISHGANPDPGFRKDAAPTALALAIAAVQPGWGNSAPMQIELDPGLPRYADAVDKIVGLIRAHTELGGTQINMNVLDKARVLEAHHDPSKYPDLVVRVTGFSAYFASLSPEFRQLVVDRILSE